MTILQRSFDQFPDLLAVQRKHPQRYPFLLESVAHCNTAANTGEQPQSSWDILFAFPQQTLKLDANGKISGDYPAGSLNSPDFLDHLDNWWQQEYVTEDRSETLPFVGGWFLYLGYELAGQIEPVIQLPEIRNHQRPQAMAVRCPAAILRDRTRQRTIVVCEENSSDYLDIMLSDLQPFVAGVTHGLDGGIKNSIPAISMTDFHEEPAEQFLNAVKRIKSYIREGDIFQVNLSRCWKGQLNADMGASDLYASLRRHNPAPFAGLCIQEDWAIISSSPERLVRIDRDRHVETRPIAGTSPRRADIDGDKKLSEDLLQHPKERAEHIMLIDMERNDLGRVCRAGSIEVNELMVLESYPHVHHIVSNVRGHLRNEVSPGDVIRAVFPGGTITGCPKVRCMEIIAELEQDERGPYTGSMGYLNCDGSMDLNILIRSLTLTGRDLNLRAGAGIVADSIPARELAETRAKARGLLLALGITESGHDADQWHTHDADQCA